ncbi:MAG: hypothetical protein LIP28_01355 [Deltaproteobacteria bacterium]|nr:hypothetical protein [Deltaproteobacteria bacterium]
MSKRTTTVSLARTPVQRALAKAKRSTLLLLFALGVAAGLIYKAYFQEAPADHAPPAASQQR